MKLYWTGTDSLMLVDYSMRRFRKKVYWWIFRRLIRVMDFFIQEHYCDAENVAENVRRFGTRKKIKVVPDKFNTTKYNKIKHEGFNILYYFPISYDKEFTKWLYGYDLFLKAEEYFSDDFFLVVHGSDDMSNVYPWIDFYLRPNRHDGASRMRQECEIQDIPYYWTQKDPNINDIIKAILDAKANYKDKGILR